MLRWNCGSKSRRDKEERAIEVVVLCKLGWVAPRVWYDDDVTAGTRTATGVRLESVSDAVSVEKGLRFG